jgi:hypothetical protein
MARAKRRNRFAEDGTEIENEIEGGEELEGAEEGAEETEHAARAAAHDAADLGQRTLHRMQHSPFDPFDVFGGPMARLMDQNWSVFQKMMHVMREESLEFVNRRLEQTNHAFESTRGCDGISDLLAVQQEWIVNFARDYAEQTKRFAELMRDVAENGTTNLSHASSEVAERGRHAAEEQTHHAAA